MRLSAFGALALALTLGTAANAADLIQNGNFTDTTGLAPYLGGFSGSEVDPAFHNTGGAVDHWTSGNGAGDNVTYNIWFKGNGTEAGGPTGTDANSRWGEAGQRPNVNYSACNLAGCGGAFMVLDGDPVAQGPFSQVVNGLVAGTTYSLTFDWAAGELQDRQGFATEQLHVFLDAAEQSTSIYHNTASPITNPGSFSGWQQVTMLFTATTTSQTLKFLSDGSPSNNLPPVAFLDNVSLTPVTITLTGTPEPATWAMMLLGFGGLGAMLRRRRALAAA